MLLKMVNFAMLLIIALCTLSSTCVGTAVKENWQWVKANEVNLTSLVAAGQEGSDPYPTYVCRARVSNTSVIPGKYVPNHKVCYVRVGKQERYFYTFELLLNDECYHWCIGDEGDEVIPDNAIEGGYDNNQTQFICRTRSVKVRKFLWTGQAVLAGTAERGLGLGACYATWNRESRPYYDYEILVNHCN